MPDILSPLERRSFIKILGATGALAASTTEAAPNADTLNIGVIGLGSRGSGAVFDALRADPNTKLTAVAELFPDRLSRGLQHMKNQVKDKPELAARIDVPEEAQFSGEQAYEELLKEDVDLVILTTPPFFRPLHAEAAINAGKHVFAEKPLATDAVGLRRIEAACKKAQESSLSFLTGFCYRYHGAMKATYQEVENGAIGDVLGFQGTYNSQGAWHRGNDPKWSAREYQLRNWYYFTWLSGDQLVEQAIHTVDKMSWAMGDKPPLSCVAVGGRQSRTDEKFGNVFDHVHVTYEYPNHIFGDVMCRQQRGATPGVRDIITGSKGNASLMNQVIRGEKTWRYNKRQNPFPSMYIAEHQHLFQNIRKGTPHNDNAASILSCGLGIMGRMAAYTGRKIHWDHATEPSLMQSKLDLTPNETEMPNDKPRPVPRPGITPWV